MRKFLLLLFLSMPAYGMQQYQDVATNTGGRVIGLATITVTDHFTGRLAALFSVQKGVTALSNPLTANGDGSFSFYAPNGSYDIAITGGPTVVNKFLFDSTDGGSTFDATGIVYASAYGAIPDGRTVSDASISSGTAVVTSATMQFVAADVGKICNLTSATTTTAFGFTILTVTNSTTISAERNSSNTISGGNLVCGTDTKAALIKAMNAIATTGGTAQLGRGIYMTSGQVLVPDGILLLGLGYVYGDVAAPATKGSVISAGGNFTDGQVLYVGTIAATYSGTIIDQVSVDAANLVGNAIKGAGYKIEIRNSQAWRAINYGITNEKTAKIFNNLIGQQQGDGINATGGDSVIQHNIIKQFGGSASVTHAGVVIASSLNRVTENHIWQASPVAATSLGNDIIVRPTSGTIEGNVIANNYLDGVYGHSIFFDLSAGSSLLVIDTVITGNTFFQVTGMPDQSFDAASANILSGNNIRGVTMGKNVGHNSGGANSWSYIFEVHGTGGTSSINGVTVTDNVFHTTQAVTNLTALAGICGNMVYQQSGTTPLYSCNRGKSTQSGNGVLTAFTIAHSLAGTPQKCNIGPSTPAAQAASTVTYDGTNATVTFSSAPANSANNLVFNWDCTMQMLPLASFAFWRRRRPANEDRYEAAA